MPKHAVNAMQDHDDSSKDDKTGDGRLATEVDSLLSKPRSPLDMTPKKFVLQNNLSSV